MQIQYHTNTIQIQYIYNANTNTMQYNTIQYHTNTIQIQYIYNANTNTMQYNTIQYHTNTIQYNTIIITICFGSPRAFGLGRDAIYLEKQQVFPNNSVKRPGFKREQ